ncbi:SHOCT domain-containing protein [Halohasta litorea]|uniref:SHOCT domain-containing protein n=1 Tax=Halohasta litorea TaxID=869891 RepID=A0ABD6D2Y5_9EURY|nr:SHOCT domain-containing protein [Halohasta litorea]
MSGSRRESPLLDDGDTPLQSIVAGVTTGLVLTVAFGLLALGVPWFWVVFPVGFGGLLPVTMGVTKWYEHRQTDHPTSESTTTAEEDALETLRNRYARGKIDEAEFERRLDALLETESVDDAGAYAARETLEE